jgi:hypothetical protein
MHGVSVVVKSASSPQLFPPPLRLSPSPPGRSPQLGHSTQAQYEFLFPAEKANSPRAKTCGSGLPQIRHFVASCPPMLAPLWGFASRFALWS